jgi:hypothetical protein
MNRNNTKDAKEENKQLKTEIEAIRKSEKCPFIVRFYGTTFDEVGIDQIM